MTDGDNFGNDDKTNPLGGSPDDLALELAADSIEQSAQLVAAGLRAIRKLPPDRRGMSLRHAALTLGELATLYHEMRRAITKMDGWYLY